MRDKIKNKILLVTLTKSLKSLDKFPEDRIDQKVSAYTQILLKATEMLTLVNARIEGMDSKTEKKLKRERDKITLNEKIYKYMSENREFVDQNIKDKFDIFESKFLKLKDLLKV